jgi:rod shape-determining protein MreC
MNKLNIALVVAILAVAIYFSTISPSAMQAMQSGFMSMLSPFLRTGSAMQENLGSVGRRLQTLDELEVENKKLLVENRELRAENNLLNELETENSRLRMALDFRDRSSFKLMPARIISGTPPHGGTPSESIAGSRTVWRRICLWSPNSGSWEKPPPFPKMKRLLCS